MAQVAGARCHENRAPVPRVGHNVMHHAAEQNGAQEFPGATRAIRPQDEGTFASSDENGQSAGGRCSFFQLGWLHRVAFIIMSARLTNRQSIAARLREQTKWCRRLGSELYANLLEQAAVDVERGGPTWAVLRGREGDPPRSALALRFLGAVHRLVLDGRAPELANYYASVGGDPGREELWAAFRNTLESHCETLRSLALRPVQTNEVGRSAALLGGFLLVAQATGLPLRLMEIGASAGLNLRWDCYRYEAAGAAWGDPDSPVRFSNVFDGRPPLEITAQVAERSGCDVAPLDPNSAEDQLTLLSYIWPDQLERLERLRSALEIARRVPALIEAADAPEWLAARLHDPNSGTARVVFHSVVMPYLSRQGRERVRKLLERAGAGATSDAPLAWLSMEAGEDQTDIRLTLWPGGTERLIARAGYHGYPVRWLAGFQPVLGRQGCPPYRRS